MVQYKVYYCVHVFLSTKKDNVLLCLLLSVVHYFHVTEYSDIKTNKSTDLLKILKLLFHWLPSGSKGSCTLFPVC